MRIVQEVLTQAREILQDEDVASLRYSDLALVGYFNDCISDLKRLRPDVFILGEALPVIDVNDLAADFPLPYTLFLPAVYFIAGHAELRDDEFAVDGRAMTLIGRYTSMSIGT